MEDSFQRRFSALLDAQPYRWQRRLYDRLVAGDVPEALDLPTGLGKTSVIAIWLLAKAAGANLPRRLVYVVDRRTVVDQATEVAERIAERLGPDPQGNDEVMRETLSVIRRDLGLKGGTKLPISTMRGGLADDRDWLYDPSLPAIVIGTVDLIGSRLLLSGYRLSPCMRPWVAGLLGSDAMIVLDEAHIAPAFKRAVQSVLKLRTAPDGCRLPGLHLLPLSATPADHDGLANSACVFSVQEEDHRDEPVARRLGLRGATKRIQLQALPAGKDALAEALATEAIALDEKVRTVLVYADLRRDGAVRAADRLRKLLGPKRHCDVLLLTGALRGHERDELANTYGYRAFRGEPVPDKRTRYLVCTAAGEVGADLDADAAVMDLVPLERMVQRLGRVNRTGRNGTAPVTVLFDPAALTVPKDGKDETKAKAARLAATAAALRSLEENENGDASPLKLVDILAKHRKDAVTPAPPIPIIEREHVEAWSLTSLRQHAGRPHVEPFIRGIEDEAPTTAVAWRPDLSSLRELPDAQLEAALEVGRLRPAEVLEASLREVAEWLQALTEAMRKPVKTRTPEDGAPPPDGVALVFRAGTLTHKLPLSKPAEGSLADGERLVMGDVKELARALRDATILVDTAVGGLDRDGALDGASREPVAYANDALLVTLTGADNKPKPVSRPLDCDDRPKVGDDPKRWRKEGWRVAFSARLPAKEPAEDEDERPGPLLQYWTRRWSPDGDTTAEPQEQALDEHQKQGVAELTRQLDALGITRSEPLLAEAMLAAMAFHDVGKRRLGMQQALGGSIEKPLAKSGHNRPLGLEGYRHELGSVRDALGGSAPPGFEAKHAALQALPEDYRELALHLIASHHGHGRPNILPIDEDDVAGWHVIDDALGIALRFARLQRTWGVWGLAWLEAVFRAADGKVSRDRVVAEEPEQQAQETGP